MIGTTEVGSNKKFLFSRPILEK